MKIIKEPLKNTKNIEPIFHEVRIASQLRQENIISIYMMQEVYGILLILYLSTFQAEIWKTLEIHMSINMSQFQSIFV